MNTRSLIRIPVAGLLAALITTLLFQQLARLTAPMEFVPLTKTVPIDYTRHITDSGPPPVKERELTIEKAQELEKIGGPPSITDGTKFDRVVPVDFTKGTGIEIPHIAKTGGDGMAAGADRSATPTYRRDPTYPSYAAAHNIEGWVRVRFDITTAGAVSNARVVAAKPMGMFEASALNAIASWRYQPQIDDGAAVEQRGLETVIRFELQ
jgi:protein TonB